MTTSKDCGCTQTRDSLGLKLQTKTQTTPITCLLGLCAFNERMQMSTMSWVDPRASFRPRCNYCGLGRDFITQKINSMISPPQRPLHCPFCKNNPLRFFLFYFSLLYFLFFSFTSTGFIIQIGHCDLFLSHYRRTHTTRISNIPLYENSVFYNHKKKKI